MQRRELIKNLSFGFSVLLSGPAWASNWKKEDLKVNHLASDSELWLAEICETILPEGKDPGSKSLEIHKYIERMVYDCYGKEAISMLESGITAFKNSEKDFMVSNKSERLDTLKKANNEGPHREFIGFLKNNVIKAYTSSEHFMHTYTDYNMAPGFYKGCIPVKK
jgi:hypothetical protein